MTGAIAPPARTTATSRRRRSPRRSGSASSCRTSTPTDSSDQDIDDIARYVRSTVHPDDAGGWGIGHVGPIPEGMIAWTLAIASLLLIARLIGEREPR